jgi:hypothetical protein
MRTPEKYDALFYHARFESSSRIGKSQPSPLRGGPELSLKLIILYIERIFGKRLTDANMSV